MYLSNFIHPRISNMNPIKNGISWVTPSTTNFLTRTVYTCSTATPSDCAIEIIAVLISGANSDTAVLPSL